MGLGIVFVWGAGGEEGGGSIPFRRLGFGTSSSAILSAASASECELVDGCVSASSCACIIMFV